MKALTSPHLTLLIPSILPSSASFSVSQVAQACYCLRAFAQATTLTSDFHSTFDLTFFRPFFKANFSGRPFLAAQPKIETSLFLLPFLCFFFLGTCHIIHIIYLSCYVLEITIPDNFTMENLSYLLFIECFLGL